jgi:putative FmdB family regulatory protein
MPIYEFHCSKCHRDSEILLRTTDWSEAECPHCGGNKLEKKLSVFAPGQASEAADFPACTGVPSSCGRCIGQDS